MSNPWDDLENSSENKRKRGASSDKKTEGAQSSSKSDNDIFGRSFFKEDKSDNDLPVFCCWNMSPKDTCCIP